MTRRELEDKMKEDDEKGVVPWRDVPQYFKYYIFNEVVIVMSQAIMLEQTKHMLDHDKVYGRPSRTREINLAQEGESDKLVFIGGHLSKEETENL